MKRNKRDNSEQVSRDEAYEAEAEAEAKAANDWLHWIWHMQLVQAQKQIERSRRLRRAVH